MFTVPNVISLTQSDAKKAIHASGLQVGTVTSQPSDTVPLGSVIDQTPKGLTQAKANSKVDLVVSGGKAAAKDVIVPDLKGKAQKDAEKALSDAGLVGVASNPEESDAVQPGQVFKQSIQAGTKVKEGTKIAFTVALAPAETKVPNVVGLSHDDAKKAITDAKLGFDSTTAYSDTVAEGVVISQSIPADTQVRQGTNLVVNISLGPKPQQDVTVPDVMSYSWTEAQSTMSSAGLAVRYTGDPAGVVVAQDIAPGTKVAPNSLVTVTLSVPVHYVDVPNLVGMSVSAAEAATDSLNLVLDASNHDGTVTDQWPAAGTQVEERTTISVTVKGREESIAEAFLGDWQADRASLTIKNAGGGFLATVNWSSSATESTSWEYVCNIDGDKLVCKSGGRKSEFDADTQQDTLIYDNGSATFSLDQNGNVLWKDNKEDAGNGLRFGRMG